MRPTRAAALAALVLATAPAFAADWETRADSSSLGFTGSAQGESFTGVFNRFRADIRFDPDALDASAFDVHIDLASVDTRNSERDETLLSADFFRVRREAQARYRASRFRDLGDGRYAADGELTLRGVTRPVTLEFSFSPGAPAVLEGRATLDRIDFDVGGGEWADASTIAHAVHVTTRLELDAAGPPASAGEQEQPSAAD